ncbi:MAG: hypothetical protein N2038_03670 [Geminicoccaceae bacterium]|nr:hypothetical protein [Geminicoccaceae bacterium]
MLNRIAGVDASEATPDDDAPADGTTRIAGPSRTVRCGDEPSAELAAEPMGPTVVAISRTLGRSARFFPRF